jgi:hypothetical protein
VSFHATEKEKYLITTSREDLEQRIGGV